MEWEVLKKLAEEFVETPNATIRSIAREYGIAKSTLHQVFHTQLRLVDEDLYRKVLNKLSFNLRQRAKRGGIANGKKRKQLK